MLDLPLQGSADLGVARLGQLEITGSCGSLKPGEGFAFAVDQQGAQVGGHKDHDNPAATTAPSSVDEARQATFWQGVFRLGQR